jgi:hypothetical protein
VITGYSAAVTVLCTRCGVGNTHDYLVTDACDTAARLSYARAYLRTLGWVCDGRGDFCPAHMPGVGW